MKLFALIMIIILLLNVIAAFIYLYRNGSKSLKQYYEFEHGMWPTLVLSGLFAWIIANILIFL